MLLVSTALPAVGFSAVLSLLTLDARKIVFGMSKDVGSDNRLRLWGTLDSGAIDATNAEDLGLFEGTAGSVLPPNFRERVLAWPYLLVQRVAGSTAGTFFAVSDELLCPAPVTQAAPAAGSFTAIYDLTAFSASWIRFGASAFMTAADVFELYLTVDATATNANGCLFAGRFTGGAGPANNITLLAQGWPYALVRRLQGATPGNCIAAGVLPYQGALGGDAWLQGGNAFGAPGVLGTTDGQPLQVLAANQTVLASDGVGLQIGHDLGASAVALLVGTGGAVIAANATDHSTTLGSTTGASATTVRSGTDGLNVQGEGDLLLDAPYTKLIAMGDTCYEIRIGTAASAKLISVGNNTGGTEVNVLAGSAGFSVGTAGAGPITLRTDTTGDLTLDSGTSGNVELGTGLNAKLVTVGNEIGASAVIVNVGTGSLDLGVNATNHATRLGTQTGASLTIINGGTDGIRLETAGGGDILITAGTDGTASLDSGSTGPVNVGATENAKLVTIGNSTGATQVLYKAGTGGHLFYGAIRRAPGSVPNRDYSGTGNIGSLGTASTTVDAYDVVEVAQTTAGQTLVPANPSDMTSARHVHVCNVGTQSFTMLGKVVPPAAGTPGSAMVLLCWSPAAAAWISDA